MLYHPDIAIAFTYVFMEFLMIPVGMIFGAHNSPSWWCVPAKLRAHAAAVLSYQSADLPLAEQVQFVEPPTAVKCAAFVQAIPDAIHQGTPAEFHDCPHHAMFVDDNICAAIWLLMMDAIWSAEGSAYVWFGHPDSDYCSSVLQEDKFPLIASFATLYLGLLIDTWALSVTWLANKQEVLLQQTDEWLWHQTSRTPAEIAMLLGWIQNGGYICPLNNFLSFCLQWILSNAVTQAGWTASSNKWWWHFHHIHIPSEVFADLKLLQHC